MGFLGILEDTKLPHVPASVILNEQIAHSETVTSHLKRGKGKDEHIVLVPQPSDDPNDPLNWSPLKKLRALVIVCFGTCLYAATFSPLLNTGLVVLAVEFNRPIGDITLISGYMLLVAGATAPLVSACSRKWGKRPVFLGSALFGIVGSIVGSVSSSYETLLAARIIQGLSVAAYESLVVSMVGDLYCVHERGSYMSAVQFLLASAGNFSPTICGPITENLGWRYLFHLCILFTGLQFILLFLFVPETQFRRDHRLDIDELASDNLEELAEIEKRHASHIESQEIHKLGTTTGVFSSNGPGQEKTFLQELAVFTGKYCDDNFLQLVIAPFAVCTNLFVLWVVVISGYVVATYVAQAYVLAQIFTSPPYSLSAAGVGYLFLGPFTGGLIGLLVFGTIANPTAKWCSAKNGGIYEPEFRLLPTIGGLAAGAGLMGFGVLCQQQASYYATAVLHGITIFGIVAVAIGTAGYALDAFRDMSSEIFVSAIIFKNFLFYGFSYFVNSWTATRGPAYVFFVFGGVTLGLVATTPLVYVYGKKYRSFWARHNVMRIMHIKTHSEL
ncbi:uncharacterized protein A1O5_02198 [Cladophialophora psammophila CBS 110553]|uniref:Major facilitator superfamily (MFS) profile domain-containing protein n=1 Tax=Cladophialophora psammophila CBS 110553 TaxID=1182543 RepID=W9XUH5_9EURO|nr:uncharacterized protein A1O5_02198 [Cladophialophora psammophila CBS 110553]EXJ73904.1 hypothetical protein A1O5_02198 [Cladophialophora psammophila CBS 110553]